MRNNKAVPIRMQLISAALLLLVHQTIAQTDSTSKPFSFQAYAEAYYSYDFNDPSNDQRPAFIYNFNQHNQPNINLVMVKGAYQSSRFRANLALAAGTYVNANYTAEPDWAKHLYEANAGVKLMKQQELWLDAGIFSSHIGFASAIGKDNYTLTRSLCAEGTPYYESGLKLGYTTPNQQWFFSALLLNGWQHISRPKSTSSLALGTQVTYKPTARITINSSSFFGNELPDTADQPRYFHNLYALLQLSASWDCIAGLDMGWQRKAATTTGYDFWYNPTLVLRYKPHQKVALAARLEYFGDDNEVINKTEAGKGFNTFGWSMNADWQLWKHLLWRAEYRSFNSREAMFVKDNRMVTNDAAITTSLCFWL